MSMCPALRAWVLQALVVAVLTFVGGRGAGAAPISVGGGSGSSGGVGPVVPVRPKATVVIGTLDGHVFARDAWNGALQWHFDSGGSMISASAVGKGAKAGAASGATAEDADAFDDDGNPIGAEAAAALDLSVHTAAPGQPSHARRTAPEHLPSGAAESMVVPGLDGAMYLFDEANGPKVLSHRVKELVHAARPVFLQGGKVLTTQKDTKVFPLGAHTGEARAAPGAEGAGGGGTLFVGRTEYKVRAMDGTTGEAHWKIFVGEYELLQEEVKREAASPEQNKDRTERARSMLPRFEVAPGPAPGDPEVLLAFANGPLGPAGSSQDPLWRQTLPSRALTLCGIADDELLWRRDLFKLGDVDPSPAGYERAGDGNIEAGAGLVRSTIAASWVDVPPAVGMIMDVKTDRSGSVYTPGAAAEAAGAGLLDAVPPTIGGEAGVMALPAEATTVSNALPAPELPAVAAQDELTGIAGPQDALVTGVVLANTDAGSCAVEIDVAGAAVTPGSEQQQQQQQHMREEGQGDHRHDRRRWQQRPPAQAPAPLPQQQQLQQQGGGQFFTESEMKIIVLSLAICMSALVAAVLMKQPQPTRVPAEDATLEVASPATAEPKPAEAALSATLIPAALRPKHLEPPHLHRSQSEPQVLEALQRSRLHRSNTESLPGVPQNRAPSPNESMQAGHGTEPTAPFSKSRTPSPRVSAASGSSSTGQQDGADDEEEREAAFKARGAHVRRRYTMDETTSLGAPGSSSAIITMQSSSTRAQRSNTDPEAEEQQPPREQRVTSLPALPHSAPKLAPLGLSYAPDRFKNEFEKLEMLGRGGFGSVFKCKNRLDGVMYAMKEVRLSSGSKQYVDQLRKVLREVKILAQLEHRNIVRYYGAWLEQVDSESEGSGGAGAPGSRATESKSQLGDGSTEWGDSTSAIGDTSVGSGAGFGRCDLSVTEASYSSRGDGSPSAAGNASLGFDWERNEVDDGSGGFVWDRGDGGDDDEVVYIEDDEEDGSDSGDEEETIGRDMTKSSDSVHKTPALSRLRTESQSTQNGSGLESAELARSLNLPADFAIAPSDGSPTSAGRSLAAAAGDGAAASSSSSSSSSGGTSGAPGRMGRVLRSTGRQAGRRRRAGSKKSPVLDNCLFIQMEYCAEATLRDHLDKEDRTIVLETVLDQVLGICKGLRYIHDRNMVHRDVKPSNIFVACDESSGPDGEKTLKLGDFGLARNDSSVPTALDGSGGDASAVAAVGGGGCASPTKHFRSSGGHGADGDNTAGVGTQLYASPEQMAGQSYDAKTDMFSLGMTLFELLHPPMVGSKMERQKVLGAARRGELPADVLRAAVEVAAGQQGDGDGDGKMLSDVLEVLRRLLATEPKDRPGAKELQSELERIRGISVLTHAHRGQAFVVRVEAKAEQQMQLPTQVDEAIERVWEGKSVLRFGTSTDKDKCVLELELGLPKIKEKTEMLTHEIRAAIQKLDGVSSVSVKVLD